MTLSEKIKNEIDGMRGQFPTTQALLIPLLHKIQQEQGWLSVESLQEAAIFLELPLSKVKEVVTFYTMFQQEPIGKFHLQLCTNISCWLNGSDKILHCLENRLGIQCGETTPDKKYTLSEVECLASCGTAPVLQINEDYHENLSVKDVERLLDTLDGVQNLASSVAANSNTEKKS